MKNWLIGKILGYAGKRLDGYGTKICGVGAILLGVAGFLGAMFPGQGLPEMSAEIALGYIIGGCAAVRGRKAIGKVEAQNVQIMEMLTPQTSPPNAEQIQKRLDPHISGQFGPPSSGG